MRRGLWLSVPLALALLPMVVPTAAYARGGGASEQTWKHLAVPQSEILRQAPNGVTRSQRIEAQLNELGRQGWELAAVSDGALDGESREPLYLFKRPAE